jgi:hypothetical protein
MKTKKKKIPPAKIPADVRRLILKKFRAKDGSRTAVLGVGTGYRVVVISTGLKVTAIREFALSVTSEIPESIWRPVTYEMATWFARYYNRHREVPSQRRERGRRRRMMKTYLASHQAHMQTKNVVRPFVGPAPKVTPVPTPPMLQTFIVVYDPKQRLPLQTGYFRLHAAGCGRVDNDRRMVKKSGGCSWVIEANTPEQAIATQVADLAADGKGFDGTDITCHDCVGG